MHSGNIDSSQTLHDFVLDLLTNPDARAAFDLDPEGALRSAGLTDVTAADVQEVVPLVMDYAPVHGIATPAPVGDLTGAAGSLPGVGDTSDAINHLQSLAQQVTTAAPVSTGDANAWAAGAMTVDPFGAGPALLGDTGLGFSHTGVGPDLSVESDVGYTLDADLPTGPTDLPGTGQLPGVGGLTDGLPTDGLPGAGHLPHPQLGGLPHLTDGLDVGDPLGGVRDLTDGALPTVPSVPSVPHVPSVSSVPSTLDSTVDGVTSHATSGVQGDDGALSGGAGGLSVSVDPDTHGVTSGGGLLDLGDGLL